MVKEKVASIKRELQEKEAKDLQQALMILTESFGNRLLEELNDPGTIKAGYIGIASNQLFSTVGVEVKYLSKRSFGQLFKYIKTYCREQGLRVKVINKEPKFFYIEIVFIEYQTPLQRVLQQLTLLINRYLLSN